MQDGSILVTSTSGTDVYNQVRNFLDFSFFLIFQ